MDRKKLLEETELFVLDMDGTFYLDTQILDGSLEFLRQVDVACEHSGADPHGF